MQIIGLPVKTLIETSVSVVIIADNFFEEVVGTSQKQIKSHRLAICTSLLSQLVLGCCSQHTSFRCIFQVSRLHSDRLVCIVSLDVTRSNEIFTSASPALRGKTAFPCEHSGEV